LGIETHDISVRTGLTTKEVGQFGYAAKAVGSDISVFSTAMRMLSKGLADNGEDGKKAREGLKELGVTARNSDGQLRPMGQLFEEIAKGINGQSDAANRNAMALKIFGRAGIEMVPVLAELNEHLKRAKELGYGLKESDVDDWRKLQVELVETDKRLAKLKREYWEKPMAAVWKVSVEIAGDLDKWTSFTKTVSLLPALMAHNADVRYRQKKTDEDRADILSGTSTSPDVFWPVATPGSDFAARLMAQYDADKKSRDVAAKRIAADEAAFLQTKPGLEDAMAEAKKTATETRETYFSQKDAATQGQAEKLRAAWQKAEGAVAGLKAQLDALAIAEKEVLKVSDAAMEKANALPEVFAKRAYMRSTGTKPSLLKPGEMLDATGGLVRMQAEKPEPTLLPWGWEKEPKESIPKELPFTSPMVPWAWAREPETTLPREMLPFAGTLVPWAWEKDPYKATLQEVATAALAQVVGIVAIPWAWAKQPTGEAPALREQAPSTAGAFVVKRPEFDKANAPAMEAQLAQGEAYAKGIFTSEDATRNRAKEAIKLELDYQTRKVELLAGPGGEIAAIRTATTLKLAALEKERALTEDQFAMDRERTRILQDGELRLLEIQKQREATRRQEGASIFDAITAGGGGITNYLKGFALGQGRTMFSNAYSMFTTGTEGALGLTQNKDSTLGKIMQGTMFGAKPDAAALKMDLAGTKMDLASTKMLTAAGLMQRAAVGGGAGGDGLASNSSSVFERTLSFLRPGASGAVSGGYDQNLAAAAVAAGGGPFSSSGPISLDDLSNSTPSYGAPRTGMGALGMVGAGAALAGGAFGAYSGFHAGGAQGALTGTASIAGSVGALLPMISSHLAMAGPIGMVAGMALGIAAMLMGNPKEKRAQELEREATYRHTLEPAGANYQTDIYGRGVDYNMHGTPRSSVTVNVQTLDSASFLQNQAKIGEAVRQALTSYPPLTAEFRSLVNP
jgi:hypothetical protein